MKGDGGIVPEDKRIRAAVADNLRVLDGVAGVDEPDQRFALDVVLGRAVRLDRGVVGKVLICARGRVPIPADCLYPASSCRCSGS